jgi:hypothetical protein
MFVSTFTLVRLLGTRHCVVLRNMFKICCLGQYLNQRKFPVIYMSSDQSHTVFLLLLLTSCCENLIEKTRSERKDDSTFKQSYVFQIPSLHNPIKSLKCFDIAYTP